MGSFLSFELRGKNARSSDLLKVSEKSGKNPSVAGAGPGCAACPQPGCKGCVHTQTLPTRGMARAGTQQQPQSSPAGGQKDKGTGRGQTTAQLLCFCTSQGRTRDVEPGLNAALFPSIETQSSLWETAADLLGWVQKMTGAWSSVLCSHHLPKDFQA